jgi:hypothetical protein
MSGIWQRLNKLIAAVRPKSGQSQSGSLTPQFRPVPVGLPVRNSQSRPRQ